MSTIYTTTTQIQKVQQHLLAGKSITPGHALLVYGISRLAVAIEALRFMGHEIDTVIKTDEAGKKYGEYKLRSDIVIGQRVQVKRGHGYGLPYWVKKTVAAKVVGLVNDIAYVQFNKDENNFETLPMNIKELARVG